MSAAWRRQSGTGPGGRSRPSASPVRPAGCCCGRLSSGRWWPTRPAPCPGGSDTCQRPADRPPQLTIRFPGRWFPTVARNPALIRRAVPAGSSPRCATCWSAPRSGSLRLVSWPNAPLPTEQLADAVRPFGESTMLPALAYSAPEVLAWERRHLFAGTWSCTGRLDELPAQRGITVGDVPVLLIRDGNTVTAFANTCRHRGHELLPDGGSSAASVIVCPYHAWSYTVDGSLRAAP